MKRPRLLYRFVSCLVSVILILQLMTALGMAADPPQPMKRAR